MNITVNSTRDAEKAREIKQKMPASVRLAFEIMEEKSRVHIFFPEPCVYKRLF